MLKKRFKGAIFDLDGTLACTLPDLHKCINMMLSEAGYPLQSEQDIRKHINYGERDFIKFSLPPEAAEDDAVVDSCEEIYFRFYAEHCCDNTYIYPGVDKCLRVLEEYGIWLAVHTNKEHELACCMLERLGVGRYFKMVLGDGIYPSKPAPDGSYAIARKAGLECKDFCFIGDSNVDIETAKNAGMFPLGVTWGYRSEDVLRQIGAGLVVNSAEEIIEFILG